MLIGCVPALQQILLSFSWRSEAAGWWCRGADSYETLRHKLLCRQGLKCLGNGAERPLVSTICRSGWAISRACVPARWASP